MKNIFKNMEYKMNKENTIKNIERLKEILIFVLLSICLILPVIRQVTHTLIFSLNNECNIIKFIGLIGIIGLVLSICISRIYLGVHYFSDVLCGFLEGVIILLTFLDRSVEYVQDDGQ